MFLFTVPQVYFCYIVSTFDRVYTISQSCSSNISNSFKNWNLAIFKEKCKNITHACSSSISIVPLFQLFQSQKRVTRVTQAMFFSFFFVLKKVAQSPFPIHFDERKRKVPPNQSLHCL